MQTKRMLCAAMAVLLAAMGAVALACMHLPGSYKGDWKQTEHEALVLWKDGREELVLRIGYHLHAQKDEPLPQHIGWVIPLPSTPDKYAVEKPELFDDLAQMAKKVRKPEPRTNKGKFGGAGAFGGVQSGVEVVDRAQVGEYDITALKGKGPDAARELNAWLTAAGYNEISLENMSYYTQRQFTFLAIKVNSKHKQRETLGQLRPLLISFASEKIFYPLKFSTHQGVFSVRLYVISEGRPQTPTWLKKRNLEIESYYKGRPMSVPLTTGLFRTSDRGYRTRLYNLYLALQRGKLGNLRHPFFTVYSGTVNDRENRLADWPTDFELRVP